MERYRVKITGGPTSMLMHADDVEAADKLRAVRDGQKANKKASVSGDDRSPAWSWKTYLYADGGNIIVPTANIQTAMMKAGAEFKLDKRKSLKGATMSLLRFEDIGWPLYVDAKRALTTKQIDSIDDEDPFEEHAKAALGMGFILDVRRAAVGMSKHVRVRPKFAPGWWCEGTMMNTNPELVSEDTLRKLLTYCGDMVGIGDWRPSSPKKPGPHGRFTIELKKLKG